MIGLRFAVAFSTCFLTLQCHARGELEPSEASGQRADPAPKARLRALSSSSSSSSSAELNFSSKLWDGLDLTDEEHMQMLFHWGSQAPQARAPRAGELPELQLLGPPDSGTNLLHRMVWRNWPDKTSDDPHDFSRFVWKHSVSSAKDLCQRFTAAGVGKNFTLLLAIRSPISQLTSWHKAPYNYEVCMNRDYSKMGEPCFANVHPDWYYRKNKWEKSEKTLSFANSMDIYNRYLRQYRYFVNEYACQKIKTLLVRYEDVVLSPEAIVEAIAKKTGWGLPASGIDVVDFPAKQHGEAVGRSSAMKKIQSRSYLEEMAPSVVAARCSELQASLVKDQFENSFSKDQRVPYLRDCEDAEAKLASLSDG